MQTAIGFSHAYAGPRDMDRMKRLTGYPGWLRLTPEYTPSNNYQGYAAGLWNARYKGMKVLVTGLGDFQGTGRHSMPKTPDQFRKYQGYIQALLKIGADAVSPWNEPNNLDFGGPGCTWQQDVELQAQLWWAVAVTNFKGEVFSSGLSPSGDNSDPHNLHSPRQWWEGCLTDPNWGRRFTVLDGHGYCYSNGDDLLHVADKWSLPANQAVIQDKLKARGSIVKLAWSEVGAPSGGNVSAGQPRPVYATPETQKANLAAAFQYWQQWERARRPLWGKLIHKDVDDAYDGARHMGLVDAGETDRPAAAVYTAEAKRVQ